MYVCVWLFIMLRTQHKIYPLKFYSTVLLTTGRKVYSRYLEFIHLPSLRHDT